MKNIFFVCLFFVSRIAHGQVLINLQLPVSGVVEKSQLWNLSLMNLSTQSKVVHLEVMVIDRTSTQQVFSATTKLFTVPSGLTQLNNGTVNPVQYNILSSAFAVDAGPAGLLPVGEFEICYTVLHHYSDAVDKVGEQCTDLLIEPISPPLLVQPMDEEVLSSNFPQFVWVAPMPAQLFRQLKYNLDLVEVMAQQSPADAMQQNIPVFRQIGVEGTSLQFPGTAANLHVGREYAWRVIATNGGGFIAQSEVWVFSISSKDKQDLRTGNVPFAKLTKSDVAGYAIFSDDLRFDYTNESADKRWNLSIVDLSSSTTSTLDLNMDTIPLKPGQNLISIPTSRVMRLEKDRLYELVIINSRKEKWRLRFMYKPQR